MIVWVDEDERTTFPSQLLLRKKGYEVELVANATDGYQCILSRCRSGLDFAIIDVMLTQGDDQVAFSDQTTRNGVITGLILLDRLLEHLPNYPWKDKALIFSRASDQAIVRQIENYEARHGIKYLRKSNELRATDFVKWLHENGFVANE